MERQELLHPSRFNTLRDTLPVPTTWEAIVTEISSNRHVGRVSDEPTD